MNTKQYVVVYETLNSQGVSEYIQLVGCYTDYMKAYGAAYLWLTENAQDDDVISQPYTLDGDTGFGMKIDHGDFSQVCFILFGERCE